MNPQKLFMNRLIDERRLEIISSWQSRAEHFAALVTERLLLDYPGLFDMSLQMNAPVTKICGQKVEARTRTLSTRHVTSLELNDTKLDFTNEEITKVTSAIAIEFTDAIRALDKDGLFLCHYVPVIGLGSIDPVNFDLNICFMTRYGTLDKSLTGEVVDLNSLV